MTVYGDDAIRVFRHHIAVGVHAERPHQVIVLLRTVNKLCFIHFIGNVLEDRSRNFHPDAYVYRIIGKSKPQLPSLLRKPFRAGPAGSRNQIGTAQFAFRRIQHEFIRFLIKAVHFGITENICLCAQITVNVFHNLQIIFCAQVAYLTV